MVLEGGDPGAIESKPVLPTGTVEISGDLPPKLLGRAAGGLRNWVPISRVTSSQSGRRAAGDGDWGWGVTSQYVAMDSDSEDFIVVGTPLEQEEEARGYRKKVTDLAVTKALPVHKQEATDAEGRRRFHGAFTGGFSAGYFNTVGSKEGWTPQQFTSSRANRAKVTQTAEDFMDDDEREEMRATALEARDDYDTFGTAAELRAQRAMAASEATGDGGRRKVYGPAIIPGPVPSDLVVPTSDPVGARLLRLMGWRRGKGIGRGGARHGNGDVNDGDDVNDVNDENGGRRSRWGGSATALVDDTPRYVLHPKTNLHGVGYDPFEGAEEFRKVAEARAVRRNADPRGLGSVRPTRGEAFGVGVFEGDDPDEDVYRTKTLGGDEIGHTYEIMSEEEEDEEEEEGKKGEDARRRGGGKDGRRSAEGGVGAVRGFSLSADTLAPATWYPPPVVPKSFRAFHVFPPGTEPPPVADASRALAKPPPRAPPPPPPVPPPSDAERAKFIDTTAMFVAKNGPAFEAMARERQRGDPKFSFLFGGPDEGYYRYKLGECRRELGAGTGAVTQWASVALGEARPKPLDADDRARMLGETPLPATMKGGGLARPLSAAPPPGTKIPEKQPETINVKGIAAGDRSRIQANLGSMFTSGSTLETQDMGHGSRALKPGLTMASSFVSAGALEDPKETREREERAKLAPIVNSRVSRDWAPESLLCKRFDVRDPFEGRAKPGAVKSFKSDSIVLTETVAAATAAAPKFLPPRGEDERVTEVPPPPPPRVPASVMPPPPPRSHPLAAPAPPVQTPNPALQTPVAADPSTRVVPGGDLRRYSTGAWGSRPVSAPPAVEPALSAAGDGPGPGPGSAREPSVREEAESFLDSLGIVPERPMEFFKAIFDDSDEENDPPPPPRRRERSPDRRERAIGTVESASLEGRRPVEAPADVVSGPAPPPVGVPEKRHRDEDDDDGRSSKKAKKDSKKKDSKKKDSKKKDSKKKSKKEKKSKKSKRSRRDRSDSSSDSDS